MKSPKDMTATELSAELDRLQSSIGEAQRIVAGLQARMQSVSAEYEKRTRPTSEPRISDHALLRYIERVRGIDVEAIRAEIMTEVVLNAIEIGATGVQVNGVRFVIKDGVIVTALDKAEQSKSKPKRGLIDRAKPDDWKAEVNDYLVGEDTT